MNAIYTVTDAGCVLEVWAGTPSPQDWAEHEQRKLDDPRIFDGAAVLSDCRHVDNRLLAVDDFEDRLSALWARQAARMRNARLAVVTRRGVADTPGLVATCQRMGVRMIPFYGRFEPACTWLGLDTEQTRHWCDRAARALQRSTPRGAKPAPQGQLSLI